MLSQEQSAIVASTVPLLEAGGEQLITYFYGMMLKEHPELRPYFNAAHQAGGDQPRALANAVLMYARNINKLEALGPLATQIINKHVALQVKAEHYSIVGQCLLRAIVDVLGRDVATPAVVDAWAAAYGQLAQILIDAERARYDEQAAAKGGWRGERRFVVARKDRESAEITSFYLVPEDGGEVMSYEPGQYLGMKLNIHGAELRRNYSISGLADGKGYRISVKREEGGIASNYLHDDVEVGTVLELNAPSGAFVLKPGTRPIALISGGVGITPMIPMLDQALKSGRQISFIHCARNKHAHAFRGVVDAAAQGNQQLNHYYCYDQAEDGEAVSDAVGYLDPVLLDAWLPGAAAEHRDVDVYFLGPKPFMRAMRRHLREVGVPDSQVHYEFFGPAAALD